MGTEPLPILSFLVLFDCSYKDFLVVAHKIQKERDDIYVFQLYLPSCGEKNIEKTLDEIDFVVSQDTHHEANMIYTCVIYLSGKKGTFEDDTLTSLAKGYQGEVFTVGQLFAFIKQQPKANSKFHVETNLELCFNSEDKEKIDEKLKEYFSREILLTVDTTEYRFLISRNSTVEQLKQKVKEVSNGKYNPSKFDLAVVKEDSLAIMSDPTPLYYYQLQDQSTICIIWKPSRKIQENVSARVPELDKQSKEYNLPIYCSKCNTAKLATVTFMCTGCGFQMEKANGRYDPQSHCDSKMVKVDSTCSTCLSKSDRNPVLYYVNNEQNHKSACILCDRENGFVEFPVCNCRVCWACWKILCTNHQDITILFGWPQNHYKIPKTFGKALLEVALCCQEVPTEILRIIAIKSIVQKHSDFRFNSYIHDPAQGFGISCPSHPNNPIIGQRHMYRIGPFFYEAYKCINSSFSSQSSSSHKIQTETNQ